MNTSSLLNLPTTRRKILSGLTGILATSTAPAYITKSLIGGRSNLLMSGQDTMPTAADYVQNGLIAMWDGIENAGYGLHDSEATVWKNLVTNSPFSDGERISSGLVSNTKLSPDLPIWTDMSCISPNLESSQNRRYACFSVAASFDSTLSVACGETVARTLEDQPLNTTTWNCSAMMGCDIRFAFRQDATVRPMATFSYSSSSFQYWSCSADTSLSSTQTRSYHVCREGSNRLGIRINGSEERIGALGNGTTLSIPSRWPLVVSTFVHTEVFCVRYYDRILSASEIAYNYYIDRERFNLK